MTNKITCLIGVDGGGTGTRVVVADRDGVAYAQGSAGASGLRNGAEFAWNSVITAIQCAFESIHQPCPPWSAVAIGLGLAGVHNKQWAAEFEQKNPGFAALRLETDAYTTLLGAHQGAPGSIVAIGTGSVGESLSKDGVRCEVGGWGFPCGDEAGGAWLGFHAINHLQQVLDGRASGSAFSDAVFQHCGARREALFSWLASASQGSYAQLAPMVVAHAAQEKNPAALQIMQNAAQEIIRIALALDQSQALPVALCGGLAQSYIPYLSATLAGRLVKPHGDSSAGALLMIKNELESNS